MSDGSTEQDDIERLRLLTQAYEGEFIGEAMYVELEKHVETDHQRQACRLLAEVESVTGQLLMPVVARHRAPYNEKSAWAQGEEFVEASKGEEWLALLGKIIPLAERALGGMKRLRELSDSVDRPAIDRLVAHEEALIEYLRRETEGRGEVFLPLTQYLDGHRQYVETRS